MKKENHVIGYIRFLKNRFGLKTYNIESAFVFGVLALTAIVFGKTWHEWVAVFAVYGTFKHASVSNRLEEKEAQRKAQGEKVYVDCYHMATKYFYFKEAMWFSYFVLCGQWSALAGVLVFLAYNPWRKFWRKHNPLTAAL